MSIKFFDMFAGIGGFRSGLEAIGGFECVGYCEIDKYAKQAYEAMYDSYPISTFWSEDSLVKAFQLPEQEKDLTIQEERCFSRLLELLPLKNLSISTSKMFPDCLTMTQAGHLKQSSVHWMSWGMMCAGRYLTAKILEYPNQEIECSLSDILEDNVPEKYYLSRKQAEKLLYKEKPTQGERIYSSKGLSCTLTSGSGGFGGHSGLYLIEILKISACR